LSTHGKPIRPSAASSSTREPTGAYFGTAILSASNSFFSSIRSWPVSSARGCGSSGLRAATKAAVAAGTFSNSHVTRSTASQNLASAAWSSYGA
jgi:hypothetical protein